MNQPETIKKQECDKAFDKMRLFDFKSVVVYQMTVHSLHATMSPLHLGGHIGFNMVYVRLSVQQSQIKTRANLKTSESIFVQNRYIASSLNYKQVIKIS